MPVYFHMCEYCRKEIVPHVGCDFSDEKLRIAPSVVAMIVIMMVVVMIVIMVMVVIMIVVMVTSAMRS